MSIISINFNVFNLYYALLFLPLCNGCSPIQNKLNSATNFSNVYYLLLLNIITNSLYFLIFYFFCFFKINKRFI